MKKASKHIIKNKKRFVIMCCILCLTIFSIISVIFKIMTKKSNAIEIASEPTYIDENFSEIINHIEDENNILAENTTEINEVNETNTKEKANNNQDKKKSYNYYIKVNYQANVVNIYKNNSNGDLEPYKVMTCSTGTETPHSGVYSIQGKWTWGALFGGVYGHYVTKIVGNILFHSVPYTSNNPASLEYWEYNKLGTSASMGCVRLAVKDSKWIFDNIPSGTPVEFYADISPGPMGKPTPIRIDENNLECRNWDPTDNDLNNPWISYNNKKNEEKAKIEIEEKSGQIEERVNTIEDNSNIENINQENTNNEVIRDMEDNTEKINENKSLDNSSNIIIEEKM